MTKRHSFMVAGVLVSGGWWSGCGAAHDAGSPAASVPSGLGDGQVLAIYNQTNAFDIDTGQLGGERGASEEVRALGRMVVADHTAVLRRASRLGAELGIAPALPAERAHAAAEHERAMAELRARTGAEFDRVYLRHEIRFHTDAIQAVRTLLIPATASSELRQLMIDVLPGFQHHLDETVAAARTLGYE